MKKIFVMIGLIMGMLSGLFAQGTINGAGATFPYPVYSAWAYDYYKTTGTKLNYQSIGSGGGVKQIISRTVEFGASDAPVAPERLEKEKLWQFPAIIGGVVPIVNIPGIKAGQLKLTQEALAKIFMDEITYWDDPLIADFNTNLKLPHKKITTVHRADGSGTTAIFTTYLAKVYPAFLQKVGKGKSVKWTGGRGAKGNEGVANYVKRIKNSIGYVEFAYAKQNKLADAKVRNHDGEFVGASSATFMAAAAHAKWDTGTHYYLWLVDAPGKDSFPITGASFILLAREKKEDNERVIKFFDWCFKNGDQTAERLIYVPLPQNLKDGIRAYWKANGLELK